MLSLLSSFSHSKLCLKLSDLLLEPWDNDSRIHSLISTHFVLNHRHVPCKPASTQTLIEITALMTEGGDHLGLAITSQGVSQHHRHHWVSVWHIFGVSRVLCFFIQYLNTKTEHHETSINMTSLFQELAIHSCLGGPLRSWQIYKMQLWNSFNIFAQFLGLDLDNEDAMWSCWRIIFWCLTNHSISITNEKKIERIFFILRPVHGQIFKHQLLALILENLNFFQIKKILTGMVLIQ